VNVVGSFAVGAVIAYVAFAPRGAPDWLRPFVAVGVCGGLTTFSTWMVADVVLLRDGHVATAVVDLLGTLAGGLLAVSLGWLLVRRALHGSAPVVIDPGAAD
jgi:CrcB protein